MGYLGKKKEWDSGVQYDKLNLSTDSDMFGCLSFIVIVCVAGLAIWHFCFTDARLAFREYMIYAVVCIVAIVYCLYRFFGEQECWYVKMIPVYCKHINGKIYIELNSSTPFIMMNIQMKETKSLLIESL